MLARKTMKVGELDCSFALGAPDMHYRIEGGERHMFGNRGVSRSRTNQEAPVLPLRDAALEARDIDESGGPFQSLTHQVDEIRTAAQILRSSLATLSDGIGDIGSARIRKRRHSAPSS
jgi:hypothetical protein